MNTYEAKLIETARDFPNLTADEVVDIAHKRAERAERAENAPAMNNNYVREFSHFENGKPIFRWSNWSRV